MTRCPLTVEVADPAELAAVIEAIERLGYPVECPRFDEWSRRAMRDSYLRLAHERMPGPDIWQKSAQLAAEVLYFETRLWPRYHLDEPPAELSEERRFLFMARKLGRLPGSDKQLHNIATKRTGRMRQHQPAAHDQRATGDGGGDGLPGGQAGDAFPVPKRNWGV